MNRFFEFAGSLLVKLGAEGGAIWGIFLFTGCVTLLMLVSIISEIRSLQLAEQIRPLQEKLEEKFKNKPDQLGKELIKFHKKFGYNTFLGISGNLVHVVTAGLLAGVFLNPQSFLPGFSESQRALLWIDDLALSPLQCVLQGPIVRELLLAAAGILILDYLMSVNARYIIRRSLMPVDTVYKVITWLTLAAAILLPQAVWAYFVIYYFFKNIILILYLRFAPYKMTPAQKVIYAEYAKSCKLSRSE